MKRLKLRKIEFLFLLLFLLLVFSFSIYYGIKLYVNFSSSIKELESIQQEYVEREEYQEAVRIDQQIDAVKASFYVMIPIFFLPPLIFLMFFLVEGHFKTHLFYCLLAVGFLFISAFSPLLGNIISAATNKLLILFRITYVYYPVSYWMGEGIRLAMPAIYFFIPTYLISFLILVKLTKNLNVLRYFTYPLIAITLLRSYALITPTFVGFHLLSFINLLYLFYMLLFIFVTLIFKLTKKFI